MLVDADAIADRGGSKFAGLTTPIDLAFVTLDKTKPTLIGATPTTGATGVGHAANIVLTLSEAVRAATGTVELWRADTKVLSQSFAIDDAGRVSVSGSVVTIDPAADLADGARYYVKVSKGALVQPEWR